MALLGARGETAAQLAATLHLAGPQDAAARPARPLRPCWRAGRGELTLRAPNTMWVQSGLPVPPDFTAALAAGRVPPRCGTADFPSAAEQARQQINEAIAEQTAGKITDLLAPRRHRPATRLVLASAVYLKAAWAIPFPPGAYSRMPRSTRRPAPGHRAR